jgi:myeloid leukemia factor 1
MIPSLFGGRDPFDDPFFTRPFGSMLESGMSDPPSSTSREVSQTDRAKALVIEELSSDDEGEKEDAQTGDEKSDYQKHIGSNKEPSVEHPDDYPDGKVKIMVDSLFNFCS